MVDDSTPPSANKRTQRATIPQYTTERPNIKLLRRAIFFAPPWDRENLLIAAIGLANAPDSSPDGSARVSWAMRKVGDWLARATGDEFRLYPEGPSMSKLDRKNTGVRAAAQYERAVPIDIANCRPSILVAKGCAGSQGAKAYVCSREEHLKEAMGVGFPSVLCQEAQQCRFR